MSQQIAVVTSNPAPRETVYDTAIGERWNRPSPLRGVIGQAGGWIQIQYLRSPSRGAISRPSNPAPRGLPVMRVMLIGM